MAQAYETMYIIRPDLGEEQIEQVIGQYQTILENNGATELQIQHRGKRRFAYPIHKLREGIYIQMNYYGNGSCITAMEKAMRLSDQVIRFMTITVEVEAAEVEPEPAAV